MDEELERLFGELKQAQDAWHEHRLTGFRVGREGGPTIGSATADPFDPAWREQNEALRAAYLAAHRAWSEYSPRR